MRRTVVYLSVWVSVLLGISAGVFVAVEYFTRGVYSISNNVMQSIDNSNAMFLMIHQRKARQKGERVDGVHALPQATTLPIDRERMRRQGCVTDGFLSGYGNELRNSKLINRLSCYYLHRAVETWLSVPDWSVVDEIKSSVTRHPIVYGMFIAEAIDEDAVYRNTISGKRFHFKKMCKPGTQDRWGKDTCVPDFDRKEYRTYVTQIMKEAIDHDIQVFLIGQVQVQDAKRREDSDIKSVLDDVRAYAKEYDVDIMIGAQTNDSTDKDYLRLFDFIEGGVGIDSTGAIEDGPCFSRYLRQNWCWALLWHEKYSKKARAVFVHLDWSGAQDDDMAIFVRMDRALRAQTLRNLHETFLKKNMGFLLPVFTALPNRHGGCYGNKERYYSPDRKYGCDDESVIEDILTKSN